MGNQNSKIGKGMFMAMIMASVFFDVLMLLLSFLPFIGWIINIFVDLIATIIYWIWFKSLGIKFNNKSALISFITGIIVGAFPFVGAIGWTLDVVLVAGTIWAQEKLASSGIVGVVGRKLAKKYEGNLQNSVNKGTADENAIQAAKLMKEMNENIEKQRIQRDQNYRIGPQEEPEENSYKQAA